MEGVVEDNLLENLAANTRAARLLRLWDVKG